MGDIVIEGCKYYTIKDFGQFFEFKLLGKRKRDIYAELEKNNKDILKDIARYLCISGFSKLNKAELVTAIKRTKGKLNKTRKINVDTGRCKSI